jgi:hypothetical protein
VRTLITYTMEQVINYWNKQPCNIKHSSCEVGTREYFEEVEKRKYLILPSFLNGTEKRSLKSGVVSEQML